MIEKPTLLLFYSVDISGSTLYKSKSQKKGHKKNRGVLGWLELFIKFYKDFHEKLLKHYENNDRLKHKPVLWKIIGDEVVFYVELKNHVESCSHIEILLKAIGEYHNILKQESKDLGLKGCAWLAGFPVTNFIYVKNVKEYKNPNIFDYPEQIDFIGPQMDIGFRLSKLATCQKFIISLELAYMLIKANRDIFKWHYEGKRKLKGLNISKGYPIIWVESIIGRDEKKELNINKPDLGTFIDFCEDFFKKESLPMPFIKDDLHFSKPWSNYEEKFKHALALQKYIYNQTDPGDIKKIKEASPKNNKKLLKIFKTSLEQINRQD